MNDPTEAIRREFRELLADRSCDLVLAPGPEWRERFSELAARESAHFDVPARRVRTPPAAVT